MTLGAWLKGNVIPIPRGGLRAGVDVNLVINWDSTRTDGSKELCTNTIHLYDSLFNERGLTK